MPRTALFASLLVVAGCTAAASGSQEGVGEYTLPKGGSTVISIPSDEPMMVTFGFELGSPSWDATSECPKVNTGDEEDPFMLQLCGGLSDANVEADAIFVPGFRGQHGGGVSFHPKDGVIRVRLENLAHQKMVFQVEAEAD